MEEPPNNNGEPDFDSSQTDAMVQIDNLESYVEMGTYVSYLDHGDEIHYGRIIEIKKGTHAVTIN